MLITLAIIIVAAALCYLLGSVSRWVTLAGYVAISGAGSALLSALLGEGIEGAMLGSDISWPAALTWLGEPVFRSDALGAGLGAWCLLAGGLCIVKMAGDRETALRLSLSLIITGTLYALVHTSNMLFFAGEVALLVALLWASGARDSADKSEGHRRQLLLLGFGALFLMGASLLIGRATGGEYNLGELALPALSVWPLVLLVGFALCWLGCAPFAGGSARGSEGGGFSTLVQSLVLGVPVVALILRLEALLTAGSLTGAMPLGWAPFMAALAWTGAITAGAGAAASLLWTGTPRFTGVLASYLMGLSLWALGLDTPLGRVAAVAILLAWGAGRVVWGLGGPGKDGWGAKGLATLSLAAVPLSAGSVGVWLLGSALVEKGLAALAILPVGAAIVSACAVALHLALDNGAHSLARPLYVRWAGVGASIALLVAGVLPGLWLPLATGIAGTAGGSAGVSVSWLGVQVSPGRGGARWDRVRRCADHSTGGCPREYHATGVPSVVKPAVKGGHP